MRGMLSRPEREGCYRTERGMLSPESSHPERGMAGEGHFEREAGATCASCMARRIVSAQINSSTYAKEEEEMEVEEAERRSGDEKEDHI